MSTEAFAFRLLTGAQLRAARALLNISAQELADRTGVSLATIRRAERGDGQVGLISANAEALVRHLEAGGVEFLGDEHAGGGVRFRTGG